MDASGDGVGDLAGITATLDYVASIGVDAIWLSLFGGPAWTFDAHRRQYYFHNFLSSQPDLIFHNPDVRRAPLENMRFWLNLGVDGFRLDTANFYFHDALLRDNPALPAADSADANLFETPWIEPYNYQRHIYNINQPETSTFCAKCGR